MLEGMHCFHVQNIIQIQIHTQHNLLEIKNLAHKSTMKPILKTKNTG